jgi:hypothetical protein
MQRFELSPKDTIRLLTQEPLLIVWLTILKPSLPNTMRPGRRKTYQDHTFALRNPLDLDDDGLESLKMEHLSWSCLLAWASWRHLQIFPNTPIWESLAKIRLHEPIALTWLCLLILTRSTLRFIFFLKNDDVLIVHMRAHSILFLKKHSLASTPLWPFFGSLLQ